MGLFKRKVKEHLVAKYAAIISLAGVLVVNTLASTVTINGQTTGAVSDSQPNLFAPAGITFAIWGVIYLLLIAYAIYQFSAVRRKRSQVDETVFRAITPYFIASNVLNIAWIFAWHYEVFPLTVVLIVGMLYCLIRINRVLRPVGKTWQDRLFIRAPFSIYFGWITVATIADITIWLVSLGWKGGSVSPGTWTVVILIVAAALGLITMLKQRDWLYGAVIVWAFTGILIKHLSDTGWNGQYPSVLAALYILLPVLIMITLSYIPGLARHER